MTGVMVVSEFRTSVGLLSLDSCCGVPITMNSVLLGLRDSKLDDIQDDTWAITDWSWAMFDVNDSGEKDKYNWVSSAYR